MIFRVFIYPRDVDTELYLSAQGESQTEIQIFRLATCGNAEKPENEVKGIL